MTIESAELTDEERAELTCINFLAHTLARDVNPGTIQPCWLCMSEEAKERLRLAAVKWFNDQHFMIVDVEYDNARMMQMMEDKLQRAMGNPGAFFFG